MTGTTLAETKDALGAAEADLESHKADCRQCQVARKGASRCDESKAIRTHIGQIGQQIRSWFDQPPGSPTLFDVIP